MRVRARNRASNQRWMAAEPATVFLPLLSQKTREVPSEDSARRHDPLAARTIAFRGRVRAVPACGHVESVVPDHSRTSSRERAKPSDLQSFTGGLRALHRPECRIDVVLGALVKVFLFCRLYRLFLVCRPLGIRFRHRQRMRAPEGSIRPAAELATRRIAVVVVHKRMLLLWAIIASLAARAIADDADPFAAQRKQSQLSDSPPASSPELLQSNPGDARRAQSQTDPAFRPAQFLAQQPDSDEPLGFRGARSGSAGLDGSTARPSSSLSSHTPTSRWDSMVPVSSRPRRSVPRSKRAFLTSRRKKTTIRRIPTHPRRQPVQVIGSAADIGIPNRASST
jgi:hypothetical protein